MSLRPFLIYAGFFTLAITLMGYGHAWAQGSNFFLFRMGQKSPVDTNYVQTYRKFFTPRVFSQTRLQDIRVFANNLSYPSIQYQPNLPPNIGFGGFYHNIGLVISFQNPLVELPNNKVDTKAFDLTLTIMSRRFIADLFWFDYKGYNIKNFLQIYPGNSPNDPSQQRPDIHTLTIGTNFIYVLNWRKYSYRAAYIKTERQRRSKGSWLILGGFNYFQITADRPLLDLLPAVPTPPEIPAAYYIERGRFYNISAGGGYAHTFVFGKQKQFFINASVLTGPVFSIYNIDGLDDKPRSLTQVNWRINGRFSMGYNGHRYFAGISGAADAYNLEFIRNQYRMAFTLLNGSVYFGRRFDMRGMFKKKAKG